MGANRTSAGGAALTLVVLVGSGAPLPVDGAGPELTREAKQRVIRAAAQALVDGYIYEDVAKRMAARGRICGALGFDPELRRLTLTISLSGAPRLLLDLDGPDATSLAMLRRLATAAPGGAAAFATHAVDVLGGEGVGLRFFRQFRHTLERMAAGLPGPLSAADRHALALLQRSSRLQCRDVEPEKDWESLGILLETLELEASRGAAEPELCRRFECCLEVWEDQASCPRP